MSHEGSSFVPPHRDPDRTVVVLYEGGYPEARNGLAQLVVFKEKSGGCTAVPASWGKKMYNRFGIKEAPDWWSEELAKWTGNQRTFGKAFKKPASQRSKSEQTYAGKTTERRVALLDGIGCLT